MRKLNQIIDEFKISPRNTSIQIDVIKNAFRGEEFEIYGEILAITKLATNSDSYGRISVKTKELENAFVFFSENDINEKQLSKFYRSDYVLIKGKLIEIYGSITCTFDLLSIQLCDK